MVGADGDRLADRGRLRRLSRRDERRIRWRAVRLCGGEVTCDDLEGRDEDATVRICVVRGDRRFVARDRDVVGPVRHGGRTVAEVQFNLDDVPRVIGPSVRDGIDLLIVLERRRLSYSPDEHDVAARGNERGSGGRKGFVEYKRTERVRRPQGIGIRGGGWCADLDREQALRVVRGLPVAQGRGREDEVVPRIRVRVVDGVGRARLLLTIAEIPLEAGLANERRGRDGRAERCRAPRGHELTVARHEERTASQVHERERAETGDDDHGDDDQDDVHLRKLPFWSDRRDLRPRRSRRSRFHLRLSRLHSGSSQLRRYRHFSYTSVLEHALHSHAGTRTFAHRIMKRHSPRENGAPRAVLLRRMEFPTHRAEIDS